MNPEKLIEELLEAETICEAARLKLYSIRTALERFHVSAPKGGKIATKNDIAKKFRMKIIRKSLNKKSA